MAKAERLLNIFSGSQEGFFFLILERAIIAQHCISDGLKKKPNVLQYVTLLMAKERNTGTNAGF